MGYTTVSNGLKILDGNSGLTVLSNISQSENSTVIWNGEYNTGTASTTDSQGSTAGSLYLGFEFLGTTGLEFYWVNTTANPAIGNFLSASTRNGTDANFLTNTFQNYMISLCTSTSMVLFCRKDCDTAVPLT